MLKRISPLQLGLEAERVLPRDGWDIPLTYVGERARSLLFVTDLSHAPKWALQGWNLDEMSPAGLSVPQKPGMVTLEQGMLLVRTTPSECRIMALGDESPILEGTNTTDVTDAYAAMAVVGQRCFEVLEKLSSIDLTGPASPQAALAPVEDLTCLLARVEGLDGIPGLILTVARGYGHFLLDAVLDAGREYGVQPAGWKRFSRWLAGAPAISGLPISTLVTARK